MELGDILSDKVDNPEMPDTPDEPKAAEPAAPLDPKEPKAEPSHNRRERHREKEQTAQGKVRDPVTGQFVKKEEPAPAAAPETPAPPAPAAAAPAPPAQPAPAQEFTEREKAFLKAAQEERRQRQELEKRLAAQPQEPPKPFYEDPEGFAKNLEEKMNSVATNTRLNTAELIARSKYQDFDQKIEVFSRIVQETPGLAQKWLAAQDPAEFAYRTAVNHQRLQEAEKVGGLDALLQKAREEAAAEARTKLEAEFKAKAEEDAKIRASLPGSLSDARNSGGGRPVWGGPTSLDSILSTK